MFVHYLFAKTFSPGGFISKFMSLVMSFFLANVFQRLGMLWCQQPLVDAAFCILDVTKDILVQVGRVNIHIW